MAFWYIFIFLAYSQISSTYPIYLLSYHGVVSGHFSRFMLINIAVVLFLQFFVPFLDRKFGTGKIAMLGGISLAIGLCLILFNTSTVVALSFVIWSVGEILFFGVSPVYIKRFSLLNGSDSLRFSSKFYMMYYLAKMFGPIVGSYVYIHSVHQWVILETAIIAIISGLVMFIVFNKIKK
jgi:hypothetical protein